MVQVVASLTINPDEPAALERYFSVAVPLIERFGGEVVQRIELGRDIVGVSSPKLIMLVDYPSYEVIERVFRSREYQSIIPARKKAFLHYNVCIVNEMSVLSPLFFSDSSVEKTGNTGRDPKSNTVRRQRKSA